MRILVFVFFLTLSLFAREITDMSGQKVTVPDNITRVYGSAPPSTYAVYAIDPSFIVGLNFSPAKGFNEASGLLDKAFHAWMAASCRISSSFEKSFLAAFLADLSARSRSLVIDTVMITPISQWIQKSIDTLFGV